MFKIFLSIFLFLFKQIFHLISQYLNSAMESSLSEQFQIANRNRKNLSADSMIIVELLDFMSYHIKNEKKLHFFCCSEPAYCFRVKKEFQRAFKTLSCKEKIAFYDQTIDNFMLASELPSQQGLTFLQNQINDCKHSSKIWLHQHFLTWKQIFIEIQGFIMHQKQTYSLQIDLRDYIMRKSKKNSERLYCLEAIQPKNPKKVYFKFINDQNQEEIVKAIRNKISLSQRIWMKKQLNLIQPNQWVIQRNKISTEMKYPITSVFKQIFRDQSQFSSQQDQEIERNHSDQQTKEARKSIIKFIPKFDISKISFLTDFVERYHSDQLKFRIYQHKQNYLVFKVNFLSFLHFETLCNILFFMEWYDNWHPAIAHSETKLQLSSVQTDLVLMQMKGCNILTLNRRYNLCVRLILTQNQGYILTKSTGREEFHPHGNMEYLVFKVQPLSLVKEIGCKVQLETKIDHGGMMDPNQQRQMTINFLRGFEKVDEHFSCQKNIEDLKSEIGMRWVKQQAQNGDIKNISQKIFQQNLQEITLKNKQDEQFYSIQGYNDTDQLSNFDKNTSNTISGMEKQEQKTFHKSQI